MGTGGYLIAGALQGIGAGMVAQGQAAAKTEADEVTYRREVALENLRNQNAIGRDAAQSTNRQTEMKQEYGLRDLNASRDAVRDVSKGLTIESVKASNAQALARLNNRLQMTQDAAKIAANLSADLTKMGKEASEFRVTADGSLAAYSKTGVMLGQTKAGIYVPPKDQSEDVSLSGGRLAGAAQPKPAAKATPKPQGNSISAQERLNLINLAMADSRFAGQSGEQIAKTIDAQLREQGYTVK